MKLTPLRSLGALTLALFLLASCEEEVPAPDPAPAPETEDVMKSDPEAEPAAKPDKPAEPTAEKPKPKQSSLGFHAADPDTFAAWRNLMPGPGSNPKLHVKGTVELTATNFSAKLQPRKGSALDLDLVVTANGDIGGAMMVNEEVTWSRPAKDSDAGAVLTVHLPNGKTIPLVIEDVH